MLSLIAGLLMGWFYSFVARSIGAIDPRTHALELGKLSPYSALVLFSLGVFCSNFLWNSMVMAKPFQGPRVHSGEYFRLGTPRLHLVGILGGVIWNLGMCLNVLAGSAAGPALSYGLGQGATMIGALWGVFIWKEFQGAPSGTSKYLVAMFAFYVLGLVLLVSSRA
jgi:glucose uptake protein